MSPIQVDHLSVLVFIVHVCRRHVFPKLLRKPDFHSTKIQSCVNLMSCEKRTFEAKQGCEVTNANFKMTISRTTRYRFVNDITNEIFHDNYLVQNFK